MSDAMANNTAAPNSTRAAALERRRALSHNGGAALGAKQSTSARAANSRPASKAVVTPPVAEPRATVAQSANTEEDCGCEVKHAAEAAQREQAIEAVCAVVDNEPNALPGSVASAVRKLCQQRRQAVSVHGKTAAKSFLADNSTRQSQNGKSGRDAAKARREDLCQQGRGDDPACRPSGRTRPAPAIPAKVEIDATLRGTTVTGTLVGRTSKITGVEFGSCRAITGTEYIGAEQYGTLCATTPPPSPAKVSVSSTNRGQRISGLEVSHSGRVTGDERGAGKMVTGIEYSHPGEPQSGKPARPASASAGALTTVAGQNLTGTAVGRSTKVTGDEAGACNKLTGSQYVQSDLPTSLCGSGTPRKVSVMSTAKESTITGTEVNHSTKVTGDEIGACASVTGTEYVGLEQYQGCNRAPIVAADKVSVMQTWQGYPVSGTSVEHNSKVTGDEPGRCQSISGNDYIGPAQYSKLCDGDSQAVSFARMGGKGVNAGTTPSGTRVANGGKVTGAERGERLPLSGTPYAASRQLAGARNTKHPLAQAPLGESRQSADNIVNVGAQGEFSISTPARSAQEKSLKHVTGSSFGASGRITGPVNLATGLVSGTPEFRYRDESASTAAPVAKTPAINVGHSRLTGDGREGGFAISGAAWRLNENVTGTEGTPTRRNPTLRGGLRGVVMGAAQNKDRERPEIPPSKMTGSSGNDAKGSAITYSGGARG
jgi:hypothetical protein